MEDLYAIIKPTIFQQTVYPMDKNMKKHKHPSVEIIYTSDGLLSLEYQTTDEEFTNLYLHANEFAVIMPNVTHRIQAELENTTILEIEFDCCNSKFTVPQYLYSQKFLRENKRFIGIFNNLRAVTPFHDITNVAECLKKIIHLLDDFENNVSNDFFLFDYSVALQDLLIRICRSKIVLKQPLDNLHINRAVILIKEMYAQDLSVRILADKLKLSTSYLQTIFAKTMRQSVMSYVTAVRLERAVEYMKHKKNLYEIAVKCGFKNYRNFYNRFVSVMHTTPTEYMKRIDKKSIITIREFNSVTVSD